MTMKIKIDRTIALLWLFNFLFLTIFSGVYLMIRVYYANFPEESYYFEGGTPTTGQFLLLGFRNYVGMMSSLIVSFLTAALFWFFNSRYRLNTRLVMSSFMSTILLGIVYFLYNIVPAISFDSRYRMIFFHELKEESLILTIVYFPFSFILIALTRMITALR
jgi:hypothetical protein